MNIADLVTKVRFMSSSLVCILVHLYFNLVSLVLVPFQIAKLKWFEIMIELEPSFWNRTGRRNDKWARGHEMAHNLFNLLITSYKSLINVLEDLEFVATRCVFPCFFRLSNPSFLLKSSKPIVIPPFSCSVFSALLVRISSNI